MELGHRRLDRRPAGPGLRQERGHERHARPAHGAEPDARPRRPGHPAGGRPRWLRLAERPGHPAAGTAAASAPGSSPRRPGRGFRHDARGLRGVRAVATARHRPRDAELHPADRADRRSRGAASASRTWGWPASPGGSCPCRATSWRSTGPCTSGSRRSLPVGRGPAVQPDSWKRSRGHRGRRVRLPEAARRPGSQAPRGHPTAQAGRPLPAAGGARRPVPRGLPRGPGPRGERAVPGGSAQGRSPTSTSFRPGSSAS